MRKILILSLMLLSLGFSQDLEATIKSEAAATAVFRSLVEPVIIYRNDQFLGCGVLSLSPRAVTWTCSHMFFRHDGVFKAIVIGNGKNAGFTYYLNDPQSMVIAGDTLDAAYSSKMTIVPLDTIRAFSTFDPTVTVVKEGHVFTQLPSGHSARSLVDGENYPVLGTVGVTPGKKSPYYFVVAYQKAQDGRSGSGFVYQNKLLILKSFWDVTNPEDAAALGVSVGSRVGVCYEAVLPK